MLTGMGQVEFDGMPEPGVLRLQVADGQVLVTLGRVLVYRYDSDDSGHAEPGDRRVDRRGSAGSTRSPRCSG